MGKRELLLIGAFALVGVVIWRLTAPPPPPGQGGFSLARWWTNVRAGLQSQQTSSEAVRSATLTPGAAVRVVAVPEFPWASARVTVVGEDRADIAADLTATVYGPDEAAARASADTIRLGFAANGDTVTVKPVLPETRRRPRVALTLRMPRALTLKISSSGDPVEARGVAAVELDVRRADVRLAAVTGLVSGEQRDGELEVDQAGRLRLALHRTDARITRVGGDAALEATDGDLLVRGVEGRLDLQASRVDLEVEGARGETRIVAADGRATLRDISARVRVEARRCPLAFSPAPSGGLDVTSEDARVELVLPENAVVDLRADEGDVRVGEGLPAPARGDRFVRLQATLGRGGASVTVRTTRGDIVARR